MNYVYVITNNKTGKHYIGKTKNPSKRMYTHINDLRMKKHHNLYLQRSYNKHGEECFVFNVIFQSNDETLVSEIEEFLINRFYEHLYNLSRKSGGGDLVSYHPNRDEIAKKISDSGKARFCGENGLRAREELSLKMSGENNPMYGRKHSEDAKIAISKAKLGVKISQESREKLSNSLREHYRNEENRKRQSEANKKRYENASEREKTSVASKNMWEKNREIMDAMSKQKGYDARNVFVLDGKLYHGFSEAVEETSLCSQTINKKLLDDSDENSYFVNKKDRKPVSQETREKMRKNNVGRKQSQETKEKKAEKLKKPCLVVFSNGEELYFESYKDMSEYMCKTYEISIGKINEIVKDGWDNPKKHKHRHLKGLKIYVIGKV